MKNTSNQPKMIVIPFFSISIYTAFALAVYAYASYALTQEIRPLQERYTLLHEKYTKAQRLHMEKKCILDSLDDPAADEYALITELGRAPSNSKSILLQKELRYGSPL